MQNSNLSFNSLVLVTLYTVCIIIIISNVIQLESLRGCQLQWGWGQREAHRSLAKCCICCSSMFPGPPSSEGERTLHTHTHTHAHVHCNSTADHKVNTGREQHLYKLPHSTDALALVFLSRWSELKSALTHAHISPGEMVFGAQSVEYLTPGTSLFQLLAPGPSSCGYFMVLLQQPVLRPPFLLAALSTLRRRSDRTHTEER